MNDPLFAHFLNEGATLVIDGCGTRVAIEVTEENSVLCDEIHKALFTVKELCLAFRKARGWTQTNGGLYRCTCCKRVFKTRAGADSHIGGRDCAYQS